MKKTLFFIAVMALLASCSKTVEVSDDKGGHTEASAELTLTTITNTTKAIAEGTRMPIDNLIGFLPNFHSDISTADFSGSNKLGTFGYDSERGYWRNIDTDRPLNYLPSALSPIPPLPLPYNFSPIYWPAGDRVFMDYTAYSHSFTLPMMGMILDSDGDLMRVEPVKDSPNRMSVKYEYLVPEETFFSSDFPPAFYLRNLKDYIPLINQLGYDTGVDNSVLAEFDSQFLSDYESIRTTISDAVRNGEDIDLTSEQIDILNRGYWFYMNCYPVIHKFLQDDLLYAHDRNLKNDNHGSVKAVFNHAKAWIKVIINNQTPNDLYVSDIRFNDVLANGTLVIDNSKSEFEAYWDFPQTPTTIGAGITPYTISDLGNPNPVAPAPGHDDVEEPEVPGLIPDLYLVPSGCYGPALSIDKSWADPNAETSDPVDFLKFTYLNGGQSFSLDKNDCRTMVGRLSGMMFPAQEPGKITIQYKFWKHYESSFREEGDHVIQTLPMDLAVETLEKLGSDDTRQVSLNLPRLTWQMGKVYVYVLTIAEDEITINPFVTEWEYADPIIGPDQTGMRTDTEATETFGEGGNLNGSFN